MRMVVQGKGEGGGGRPRDRHRDNQRGNSSIDEVTLSQARPADASRESRPSQGAPSHFPLHPNPSQVPPATQVGDLDRTPGEGHLVSSQPEGCKGIF